MDTASWVFYILFLVLTLVTIILTGILISSGTENQVLLWILYGLYIIISLCVARMIIPGSEPIFGTKYGSLCVIFVQLVLLVIIIALPKSYHLEQTTVGTRQTLKHISDFGNYIPPLVTGLLSVLSAMITLALE